LIGRWLFDREVRRRHQGALEVAATSDSKFDALVGLGSKAHAQIEYTAKRVVNAYINDVFLTQRKYDPFTIGPLMMRRDEMVSFTNAVHGGYDELEPWRQPSRKRWTRQVSGGRGTFADRLRGSANKPRNY
jgi:type III restriction enzyme